MISLDILKKKKPIIAIEDNIQQLYANFTTNNSSLPIARILQDEYSNNFNLPNIFTIKARYVTMIVDSNLTVTTTMENVEILLCEPSYFASLTNESFYKTELNNYYCMKNQNVSIGGYYDATYTKYQELLVNLF